MSCNSNLLSLSTELLIHIFAYLPVPDLLSIQNTCRRTYDIVSGTVYLQYLLRTQLNSVDDISPPNCPFSERLELLRRHERAWRDLELNLYTEFSADVKPSFSKPILQDGYLIARSNSRLSQYQYVDLLSLRPMMEEPRWIHISLKDFPESYNVEFAVDHNLVVAVRFADFLIYYRSKDFTEKSQGNGRIPRPFPARDCFL